MGNSNLITTYVFGAGRKEKFNTDDFRAKEFFYGYSYFEQRSKTLLIEMKNPEDGNNLILNFVDRVIRKLTELPIYTKDIVSVESFKILKKTDKLILTTELLGLSLLPLLLIVKIFKKIEIYVIVMGLFGRKPSNTIVKFFQNTTIALLSILTNKYIFIGKGEFLQAKKQYPKLHSKFSYMPFSIDLDFWRPLENYQEKNINNNILFVGNDGKRDYNLLVEIAKKMKEFNFTFITNQIQQCDLDNVNLIKGSWGEGVLTDEQMKNYYQDSFITILPIIDTFQPSGQSVALQSIACGTPVLISRTKGFWDEDLFTNNENIFFVDNNSTNEWYENIETLQNDQALLSRCSMNGLKTVTEHLDLNMFSVKLYNLVHET